MSTLGRSLAKRPCSFLPMGFWDWWEEAERLWRDPHPPIPVPLWQARLNHRRSLPWVGRVWLHSTKQYLRLSMPRSFMTRAWRKMKRHELLVAWQGWSR